MESLEVEPDFKCFKDILSSLQNFYTLSNGHLDFKLEKNKNDFFSLNSEEISDTFNILEELNKAIQIDIDPNNFSECDEIVSLLRKPLIGPRYKKCSNHKLSKKSVFKPLNKPKKIFTKVLIDNSPLKESMNTMLTTASNTILKSNNIDINYTEKMGDETNK